MQYYHHNVPTFLAPFLDSAEMQRLKFIGMNCGCEYTGFPRFCNLPSYTRFEHSLGAALIVWHFTGSERQTLSALFHDISTPPFAHSVDFLFGDFLNQEATEAATEEVIRGSESICRNLAQLHISVDEVKDYHCYPIADNDSPRLSSDRLEYTLGNAWRYGFEKKNNLHEYYDDLIVTPAEDGQEELAFRSKETALKFAELALQCSQVYVSDEDRYSMQRLAELLRMAFDKGVLQETDLKGTEVQLISKLKSDPFMDLEWLRFRSLNVMVTDLCEIPDGLGRIIHAKKRYIDPFVAEKGRVSVLVPPFHDKLKQFLAETQDKLIYGKTE